ncbi:MAG: molybdenum cofactor biosynthesis protein MoaE [Actinomycetota bacterium]|nr:molybdenum cofactor biosynthesis protein MoaE [Actinomycetota bacterium]MDH4352926.1 molybdenum cofactor biosynthesis protein MoaE [Actinomycetota bacterium]MDH5278174.1 molybdenum cofactor biosynthesis protein MoaE [Actinomycetota bacterium]
MEHLVDIVDRPLSEPEVASSVRGPGVGGTVTFVGAVRDVDAGRDVVRLEYTAHPTARQRLADVVAAVAADYPGARLAAVHRVGRLEIGDLAVVVAAGCPHRDEAFAAARRLIDDLKATVPIWKHQTFADGTEEWVGLP